MPRFPTDYSKTIIYKLVKDDDFENANIYVGSTTNFENRKCLHRSSCYNENSSAFNRKVYKFIRENGGWDRFKMIEVEKFPCKDKRESEAKEHEWCCTLKANLNTKRPFITLEQVRDYQKQYQTIYRSNHVDKAREYKKKYYLDNLDKFKEKFNCDCGGVYTMPGKSQHLKTQKHIKLINNNIEVI
tara:strand:+ start:1688 stop:2245 length:558 start_codon:yes stop_codon:yes gene_type:complete